jgi:hypothetical protein
MQLREILLQARLIDPSTLAKAEAHAQQVQRPLVHVLAAFNVVDAGVMARLIERTLQRHAGAPVGFVDVTAVQVLPRLLQVVPRAAAEQWRILPIAKARGEDRLYLAMSDPTDEAAVAAVELATGLRVQPMVCDDAQLSIALDKQYGADEPVLVGAIVDPAIDDDADDEFLTESTAEVLELLRSGHDDHRATSIALNELTVETPRLARPASIALGDVSPVPTQRTPMPVFSTAEVTPADPPPLAETRAVDARHRVVVAARQDVAVLRSALQQMLGDVVDVLLDDVAACQQAHHAAVLVLVEPVARSALLRALLDLEDTPGRAKVLVLGGGATFAELTVVDEHGASAPEPHALAVAVFAGLRRLGVSR